VRTKVDIYVVFLFLNFAF